MFAMALVHAIVPFVRALTRNLGGRIGRIVRILLLAMPDTASSLDAVMKFPNLGLCSLAAQVPEHEVRILDLVLRPHGVRVQRSKIPMQERRQKERPRSRLRTTPRSRPHPRWQPS